MDTCCIDKTSSAELSEAINSMYRWYQKAEVCYAFLSDVPSSEDPHKEESAFRKSRWFTRGWTLQELIAPVHLTFFGSDWEDIGSKLNLKVLISAITKVDARALAGSRILNGWNVAQKMSWASRRVTTREEDIAYCLMGLFDINMPMLYGEGKKAFLRLQEEIIRNSQDETIFAWWNDEHGPYCQFNRGLLASGPQLFARSSNVSSFYPKEAREIGIKLSLVGNLIELQTPLLTLQGPAPARSILDNFMAGIEYQNGQYPPGSCLAMLRCITLDGAQPGSRMLALCLIPTNKPGNPFERVETNVIHYVDSKDVPRTERRLISLMKTLSYRTSFESTPSSRDIWIRVSDSEGQRQKISSIQARHAAKERMGGYDETPILGFRLNWANGLSIDVVINIVMNGRDDIITSTVKLTSAGERLKEIVKSFANQSSFSDLKKGSLRKQWSVDSDRVVRELSPVGVVTVKIKKVGNTWDPASWRNGGSQYNMIKPFCLGGGVLEEKLESDPEARQAADVSYLVDVKLERNMGHLLT